MNLFFKRDTRLVKGCRANNRQAQEDLFKQYYAEMLRLCFRYLKSDELAKEALNAGFLKIFQQTDTYDPKKGELGAWIRTIIVRCCIDLSRKEAKFKEHISPDEIEEVFINPVVIEKLFAEDLLNLVRQLPSATQLVFNLSVVDGYSHKEIGEQLNIAESTSRWHLSEAKKQLRAKLVGVAIDKPTENKTAR